jgi:FkbM family methyltransferase
MPVTRAAAEGAAGERRPGRWARAALGGAALDVCLADAYDPIAEELAAGTWVAPWSHRLVCDWARPGRVLLDVGAHLGTVSLAAAALGARVVAVEASARNVAALRASVAANQLDVTVVHAAAADAPGSVAFHEDGPFGQVLADGATTVRAATVPELLAEAGAPPVDLVKIDVEGHEPAVLTGAEALLAVGGAPDVVCEGNGFVLAQRGRRTEELVAWLARAGFTVFLVGEGELVPIGPGELPPANVVDFFATKRDALPWPARAPLTDAERAHRLAGELTHPVHTHRIWAATALARAPDTLLRRRELAAALEAVLLDRVAAVREAASWWRERRRALATAGHGPGAAAVAQVASACAASADGAAAVARAAHRAVALMRPDAPRL